MLSDDSIVSSFPQYLPTDEEVGLAEMLLQRPEHCLLQEQMCQHIAVGGCVRSSLRRFCWQARKEQKFGADCALGAVEWVRRCVETRESLGMNSVLSSSPFTSSFRELYLSTVPFSFHGTDRQGHPVYIVRYGLVDVVAFQHLWDEGKQLMQHRKLPVNGAVLFHLCAMEYLAAVIMREETRRQGRVVDRMLTIMDLGGLGMSHMNPTLKAFLVAVSTFSVSLFPETLHAAVVVDLPWVMARVLWPLAKRFLHPVTLAKFCVPGSAGQAQKELLELVDPANLPRYLGGSCNCAECTSGQLRGGSLQNWAFAPLALVPDRNSPKALDQIHRRQSLRARRYRPSVEASKLALGIQVDGSPTAATCTDGGVHCRNVDGLDLNLRSSRAIPEPVSCDVSTSSSARGSPWVCPRLWTPLFVGLAVSLMLSAGSLQSLPLPAVW